MVAQNSAASHSRLQLERRQPSKRLPRRIRQHKHHRQMLRPRVASRKLLRYRRRPISPGTRCRSRRKAKRPRQQQGDVFVFKKEVDEVTLHATVVDDHNRLITNLAKNDFTVFEDGKPQKITSFRSEDIPVAMGIVIDNSGSMREKRPAVNAAAINLVQSSNPQDQVFVVNFNEEYFLDQDYTAQDSQAEGCAGTD